MLPSPNSSTGHHGNPLNKSIGKDNCQRCPTGTTFKAFRSLCPCASVCPLTHQPQTQLSPLLTPLSQTGTFTDKPIPSVNECQTCHPTCKSCTGALASECASCHGSAVLKEGACSCPAGKSGTFPTRHAGTRTLLHFSPHPNVSTSFHFLSLSHAGYYGDPQDKSAGNDNCFQCPAGQNTPVLCVSLHSHSMTHYMRTPLASTPASCTVTHVVLDVHTGKFGSLTITSINECITCSAVPECPAEKVTVA